MDFMQLHLLNRFQRGFPLVPHPFAAVARQLGTDEDWVLDTLAQFTAAGTVVRVGPVFAPNTVGASTLAALSVPAGHLDAVAARVSAHPSSRTTTPARTNGTCGSWRAPRTPESLDRALAEIRTAADSGPVLDLRLEEEYHIDLGFNLEGGTRRVSCAPFRPSSGRVALVAAGAAARGCARLRVAAGRASFCRDRPSHRHAGERGDPAAEELGGPGRDPALRRDRPSRVAGLPSNAMAVWDVPDAEVSERGTALARIAGVTLCYRRRRALPDWPYNLFCMVHGQTAEEVEAELRVAIDQCELGQVSRRRPADARALQAARPDPLACRGGHPCLRSRSTRPIA